MRRKRTVRVPASSANLGPGFDLLAAALALHVEVEVVETGRFAVRTDLKIARDRRNLVVRGFAKLHDPSAFEFRITSDIPLSGGLGTSAAAYLAGLLAADSIFELDADVLALATELEGHPDNVAPATYGGFVVCGQANAGDHTDVWAQRAPIEPAISAVVFVPADGVATELARELLPAEVAHDEAAANTGRAALLVAALAGAPERLLRATEDFLHQRYRAGAMPASYALVEKLRASGVPAVVSGAGPTVLAFVGPALPATDAVRAHAPAGWRVETLSIATHGVRLATAG